jgi:CRP/FNR family transcriptional regulator, nitrogen fixation regulation protein
MSVQSILPETSSANHLTRRPIPSTNVEAFDLLVDRIGVRISYSPKARIFHEGDPARSVYKVVNGLVLTCKFLRDGRRQIGGFYLPGDYFGFACSDTHTQSAEAVTNANVCVIKQSILAAAGNRNAIERQLLMLRTRELARLRERDLLLVKNAQERVGDFICEMEKRAMVGNSIQLSMKRQDIADYLGLKIETVSRILTSLENCAAIEMPTPHRIVLCNHSVFKTVVEDRSKGSLSNPLSSKSNARKRSDRRRRSVRTALRQQVLPEAH